VEDHYKHPADERKVHFRLNLLGFGKENKSWGLMITVVSFFLSASLSLISSQFLQDVHIVIAFSVVLVIIIINVLFDIIGTAVTAADEAPFHAMASRKLYGARESIRLIRNADKVSNFCNDVVGDICGVISGTASMFIIITFIGKGNNADTTLMGLAITGMVAAFTVGGKAFGKSIAIENSNYIIYKVGVVLKFLFGKLMFFKGKKKKNRQKTSKSNGN
jgi:hypothetical protein